MNQISSEMTEWKEEKYIFYITFQWPVKMMSVSKLIKLNRIKYEHRHKKEPNRIKDDQSSINLVCMNNARSVCHVQFTYKYNKSNNHDNGMKTLTFFLQCITIGVDGGGKWDKIPKNTNTERKRERGRKKHKEK